MVAKDIPINKTYESLNVSVVPTDTFFYFLLTYSICHGITSIDILSMAGGCK